MSAKLQRDRLVFRRLYIAFEQDTIEIDDIDHQARGYTADRAKPAHLHSHEILAGGFNLEELVAAWIAVRAVVRHDVHPNLVEDSSLGIVLLYAAPFGANFQRAPVKQLAFRRRRSEGFIQCGLRQREILFDVRRREGEDGTNPLE